MRSDVSRGQPTFSVKRQIVDILVFVEHMVSVASTQLCHCSSKADVDSTEMNGHRRVQIKLFCKWPDCGPDFASPDVKRLVQFLVCHGLQEMADLLLCLPLVFMLILLMSLLELLLCTRNCRLSTSQVLSHLISSSPSNLAQAPQLVSGRAGIQTSL